MFDNSIIDSERKILQAAVSDINYDVRLVDCGDFYQILLSPRCVVLHPVITSFAITQIIKLGYDFRSVLYCDGVLSALFVKFVK